ncbi:hypothetical protein ACFLYU_03720 [Candidatus Dependentiae bacterium]
MEPNFTIVIQAINFFIGFIILRQLLFKPAIAYLQGEDKKEEGIAGKISDQKNLLDTKVEKKKKTWKQCQKHFQKSCPAPIVKKIFILEETRQEPEVAEISDKEVQYLTEHAQKVLVERMQYVHE